MKKTIATAFVLCAMVTTVALAADANGDKEAKRAAAKEKMLQLTGGLVEKEGQGRIAIVNRQTKISNEALEERVEALRKVIRVNIDIIDETAQPCDPDISAIAAPAAAKAAVYVVDSPRLPMSLVAAEAGWGILNVDKLTEGKIFKTQFNRVSIMTFGAGVSQFKGSPMQSVRSTGDLEKLIGEGFTFDAISTIMRNLQNIGVTQAKRSTYKKACEEGWAATPTNDYQRAIWEKVKAEQAEGPVNGIRIKPGDKPAQDK